uniref:SLC41A/MgtE integral membrane domain-containing protein n=1 Tax=Acrobeloides nanus TaxID=290746 RepID=A0A914ENJ4_9BILA
MSTNMIVNDDVEHGVIHIEIPESPIISRNFLTASHTPNTPSNSDSDSSRKSSINEETNENLKHSKTSLSLVSSTVPLGWFPDSKHLLDIIKRVSYRSTKKNKPETKKSFIIETSIPFFLAGLGMACAGLLFDRASKWSFLTEMKEALVLIPPLLGLKGNLEMTLASRLATWSNLGLMSTRKQQLKIYIASVALDQAQAIVVAFIAAIIASASYKLEGHDNFTWNRVIALHLASVVTASATSFMLATLMVTITIIAIKFNINPDNISTPLAGTTGDTVTLGFFILFGTLINNGKEHNLVLYSILLVVFLVSSSFWMYITSRNPLTREVLKFGWYSILSAMVISTGGGYIMKNAIIKYPDVAIFQPVINGVGGNLVAVQSSRISTYLHKFGQLGVLPANRIFTYLNPLRTFSCREDESIYALILLLMAIPGHIIFVILIFAINIGFTTWNWLFLFLYLVIGITQLSLLLYICQFFARMLWLVKVNPDNNTIPIMTALGDLFGSVLLLGLFAVMVTTGFTGFEVLASE